MKNTTSNTFDFNQSLSSLASHLDRRNFLKCAAGFACAAGIPGAAAAGTVQNSLVAKPAPPHVLRLPRRILSLLAGPKISLRQVMQHLYDAGFTDEEPLLAGTAVAIAESGLYSAARNWHPEKGYRAASDVITVKGPKEVWRDGCQLHSDRGIWQIASFWHAYFPDIEADNPALCARIAFQVSSAGTDFRPWTSFASGAAQKHFNRPYNGWPALGPQVRRFLAYQKVKPAEITGNNINVRKT